MKKKRFIIFTVAIIFSFLIFTGCSNKNNPIIDRPQNDSIQEKTVYLYFTDEFAMYLHPEKRTIQLKENESLARVILEELIKGPNEEGFYSTIPQESHVNEIKIENGIAIVDFSKEFQDKSPGGSTGEILQIGAIVQSLTELAEVQQVQFLIEGKKVSSLAGHLILDEPLSRMIQTGSPYINTSYIEKQQILAEQGKLSWRLDPLKTAQLEGTHYGLYASGTYEIVEKQDSGEVIVKHIFADQAYRVLLIKLDSQQPNSIWIIKSIEPW